MPKTEILYSVAPEAGYPFRHSVIRIGNQCFVVRTTGEHTSEEYSTVQYADSLGYSNMRRPSVLASSISHEQAITRLTEMRENQEQRRREKRNNAARERRHNFNEVIKTCGLIRTRNNPNGWE